MLVLESVNQSALVKIYTKLSNFKFSYLSAKVESSWSSFCKKSYFGNYVGMTNFCSIAASRHAFCVILSLCNHAPTYFFFKNMRLPHFPLIYSNYSRSSEDKGIGEVFLDFGVRLLRVKIYGINSSLTRRKSYFLKSSNLQNPKLLTCNNMQ